MADEVPIGSGTGGEVEPGGPAGGSFMPAKFIQDGAALDYTPVADTPAGTIVVQSELVGVTRVDLKAGQLGSLAVTGIFEFPKALGVGSAIPIGTLTYWDAGGQVATKNAAAGANKLIGKCIKTTVDADTVVRVRMSQ
jgi:predicted RecA/RadA family phage recombinase